MEYEKAALLFLLTRLVTRPSLFSSALLLLRTCMWEKNPLNR